jgi:hypothetical protein
MSKFIEKYSVSENKKTSGRSNVDVTPEEKNRNKMLLSIDEQLNYVNDLSVGKDITLIIGEKSKKPRLFWQDVLGGFLFSPRFGNDFIFGKDRGVHCSSYDELVTLLNDFKSAVVNLEFDDRLSEISNTRKGRGAGVSRNRS